MIHMSITTFVFAMFGCTVGGGLLCILIIKVMPYWAGWRDFTYHVSWTPENRMRVAREELLGEDYGRSSD